MIGIGITTCNRPELIRQCVENIIKFTTAPCKIVVVDDASKKPVNLDEYSEVKICRHKKHMGTAVSKNKCLELLDDCEHVFLFDDDCWPIKSGWEKLYMEASKSSNCFHFGYTWDTFTTGEKDYYHRINNVTEKKKVVLKIEGMPDQYMDEVMHDTQTRIFKVRMGLSANHPHSWEVIGNEHSIKSHENSCGVMLYFNRRCLEEVGGFNPEYGLNRGAHVGLSYRIHNNGLTPLGPFLDVVGSDEYFYALDRDTKSEHKGISDDIHCIGAKIVEREKTSTEYIKYSTRDWFKDLDKSRNESSKIFIARNDKNCFKAVKIFLEDKKYIPEDSIVVLGYHHLFDLDQFKIQNPGKKIIIFQLEQLFDNKCQWYNDTSLDSEMIKKTKNVSYILKNCDEIWDYDQDNIVFLKSKGFKNIKHIKLGFTEKLVYKNKNKTEPFFDIIFFGSINEKRLHFLKKLSLKYKLCIISNDCKSYKDYFDDIYDSMYGQELFDYINNSKIVINLHYYDSHLQEQVRIFELLINNKLVVSQKSVKNYFGDLIIEFDSETEMIEKIDNILKKCLWKNAKISTNFKFEKPKIGAIYNAFYGLQQIEKSINSIKKCVDYFVIVCQHHGIDMKTVEPKINQLVFRRLLNKNIDIDIVYLDPEEDMTGKHNIAKKHEFILQKRNLGLYYCKKNDCKFIIPLDTDERYDSDLLDKEIKIAIKHNIDTVYSPILSYYSDENYYFEDTYYVPCLYKVDEREFSKTQSSVLADPVRKMEERKYRISKMPMHHYTYTKDNYIEKMNSGLRTSNPDVKTLVEQIGEYLLFEWTEEKEALVFINDLSNGGNTILKYVKLKKNDK